MKNEVVTCGVSMENHTNYRLGTVVTSGKDWVGEAPIFMAYDLVVVRLCLCYRAK